MKYSSRTLGAAFLVGALIGAPAAQAKVLAKVNGSEITDQDVKIATEDLGPGLPQEMGAAERNSYVLDYLIDLKLAAKKAETDKLAEGADFERQMAYYHDKVLMESLLTKISKEAATEASMKKVYDEAAKAQKPETEVKALHILVPTEEEAKAAQKRVKAGEDFAKVADEVSKDPASKGGDLGWFTKDRMVKEFADVAFALKPGQISDPVKSQFGWHVIKVEDSRQKTFPSFDTVKDQISSYVVQKAQSEVVTKLREGAKIERSEPDALPVIPPAPAPKGK